MKTPDEVLQNCKRPEGEIGEQTIRRMNESHAELTTWGFSHFDVEDSAAVLDIGCGGGKALKQLSQRTRKGKLFGIDYSETSVRVAKQENEADVASGKMEGVHGSVSDLPFRDGMFDLVTTVESYYFWPDLAHDFREVRRVMKPGGIFAIVAEMYNHDSQSEEDKYIVKTLKMHNNTPEELKTMLKEAGFMEVTVDTRKEKGWLCAIATK